MTRRCTLVRLTKLSVIGCSSMLFTACSFGGLNSLNMPGTAGHGRHSYTVTAELPDIATLPQNSPVLVNDVTVGSVSGVEAMQRADGTFYAAVKISLDAHVRLPANAAVKVGQTSLLGSQHLELGEPTDEPATGRLVDGATIPIQNAGWYPTTEEVLSSLGVVVNKGNLGALQDITDEAYQAVAGRKGQLADFLPRLAELTAAVDRQTDDLVATTDKLNDFADELARGNDKLARAIEAVPAALKVLNENSGSFVDAFAALQHFAEIASRILAQTKSDLAADLKDAYAVVKPVADHASDLVSALPILPTYPIPQPGIKQIARGDYLNVFVTLDLTLRRFGENIFTTSALDPNMKHLSEIVDPPDFLTGSLANLSGQAADPFTVPDPSNESGPMPTGGGG
ncbi:MCE-family lipoprotein LprN [Mycobacteroides abscessus subsp. bolletii]|nr:MCE family protein [Mycobacteroides abscessus subsp. bolletii]SIB90608.1 MCE-family lipoprotein LprN [Mycobacteroides abscessus subsp. bolletii]SKS87028.1 MCE-family lipoprotein LprN [Mycobacteroides abscessus subsp. bolletii]SKT10562.1 MCE-family lipoprotein LprN [Mycobacteroides abscessus subsp. bolletii]SLD07189.1 MCE-family lipoprotein LprN [Mycobacteroides abscessus subsp. bolletii]